MASTHRLANVKKSASFLDTPGNPSLVAALVLRRSERDRKGHHFSPHRVRQFGCGTLSGAATKALLSCLRHRDRFSFFNVLELQRPVHGHQ